MKHIAIAFFIVVAGALPGAATAASPPDGTLAWQGTVDWSGGPLTGADVAGQFAGHVGICPPGACDDFFLDIQIPPSAVPGEVRFADVRVTTPAPGAVVLVLVPPGGDPSRDFTFYDPDAARILDPAPGVWRIQVRCDYFTGGCRNVTYTARATTGQLLAPTAVPHRAGAVFDPSGLPGAPRARLRQVGANAYEPTLGIAADGAVFFHGVQPDGNPKVLHSATGDRWENVSPRIGPVHAHPKTLDPYLYVDPATSRIFATDLAGAFTVDATPLPCAQLAFSDDGGETWFATLVCGHFDQQKVFAGPPVISPTVGYPGILYYCAINGGIYIEFSTATTCSKSLDGGLTWVYTGAPPFHDEPGRDDGIGLHGHCGGGASAGAVGPDGTVYVPRGICGPPYLAISRDEGATWKRVQVSDRKLWRGAGTRGPVGSELPNDHSATAVAVDAAGNLYYVFVAEDRLPWLTTSTDGGETWSTPRMIAPPGVSETSLPDVAAGAPGKIAVAYVGTETSPGGPPFPDQTLECALLVQNLCVDPEFAEDVEAAYAATTWNGYVTITDDALGANPLFYSAPVNDPTDPLLRGSCGPVRCGSLGDFLDVQIAPDGRPRASFADACAGDRCTDFQYFPEGVVGALEGGPSLGP